jgi:hypothetical protein
VEGVALAKELGSPERLAYALSVIASNLPDAHRNLHAHYAECIQAAETTRNPWLAAFARACYAVAAAQLGDLETSCTQGRQAVEQCRAAHDDWLFAAASGPLGLGLVLLGQIDEAELHLQEALPLLYELRDWKWAVSTLIGLGLIGRKRGDIDGMERGYAKAAVICRDSGDAGNLPLAFEGLAATAVAKRNGHLAARMLGAAETARAAGGQPILPIYDELFATTDSLVGELLGRTELAAGREHGRRLSTDEALTEWQMAMNGAQGNTTPTQLDLRRGGRRAR